MQWNVLLKSAAPPSTNHHTSSMNSYLDMLLFSCWYVIWIFITLKHSNMAHHMPHSSIFYIFRTKMGTNKKNFLLGNSQLFAFLLSFVVSIHFYFSTCHSEGCMSFSFISHCVHLLFSFYFHCSEFRVTKSADEKKKKQVKELKIFGLELVESSGWIFTVFRFLNTNILNIEYWTMSFRLSFLFAASTLHALYSVSFFLFFYFARNLSILLPVNSECQKKKLFRCIIIIVFYHQYWQFSNANCEYSSAHKP